MTKVTHDLLNIANRLKLINPKYETFYNRRLNRFEVHTDTVPNWKSLAFVPPFERLDTRTLEYALKTRIQNMDAIEHEMNKANERTANTANERIGRRVAALADMLDFANRAGRDVAFTKNIIKEF